MAQREVRKTFVTTGKFAKVVTTKTGRAPGPGYSAGLSVKTKTVSTRSPASGNGTK
jgi:hypothetical protein